MQKRTLYLYYSTYRVLLQVVLSLFSIFFSEYSDDEYAVQICFKLLTLYKTLAAVPYNKGTVLIVCHLSEFIDTNIEIFGGLF
jgi:hypothetical protein